MSTVSQSGLDYLRGLWRSSLYEYMDYVLGMPPAAHHKEWIAALESGAKRILIVAPPRHAKTTIVGIVWLSHEIGKNPNIHIAYCSNTARQANRQSVACRDLVALNERYQRVFPGVVLDQGKGTGENEWFVTRTNEWDKDATFQCTGVGGPILGAGVDILVLDDVADQENMATAYQRERLLEWLKQTALTRLDPGGRVVCIMTRWHEHDPAGEFQQQGWTVIQQKAVQEDGSALWPEQWPLEELEAERNSIGERLFDLMYQGNVIPVSGNVFKREWWRYWESSATCFEEHPPRDCQKEVHPKVQAVVQSWDTAFEAKRQADYSVCTTWALCQNGHYLLDLYRRQVEFPQLKQAAQDLAARWGARYVLIEGAASGKPLVHELTQGTRLPLVEVNPQGDKTARAQAVTPEFETGRVFVPREPAWRDTLEHELEAFPLGEHDDIVDSVTQYLNWARGRVRVGPIVRTTTKRSMWRE